MRGAGRTAEQSLTGFSFSCALSVGRPCNRNEQINFGRSPLQSRWQEAGIMSPFNRERLIRHGAFATS
jgi:hypothetical protein